ncbi:MAG: SDR family oxidoreductase [Chryseolinea sp.]
MAHFITGATGFVGSSIILELLRQSDDPIFCLVRKKQDKSGQERLLELLEQLVTDYGYHANILKQARKQCIVVEGDLTGSLDSVSKNVTTKVTHFWNVAASLKYEERFAKEIFEINVEGTKRALNLARVLKVDYFNHFSTAYVAGKKTGIIHETMTDQIVNNNTYERSKVAGESLVWAEKSFCTRIFRPSIVIGHSQTGVAINFSGLYSLLRLMVSFKGMMNRVQQGYLSREAVTMCIDPDARVNVIPVDMVASQAVEIALSQTNDRIFHLTNTHVPTVGECLSAVFGSAELMTPRFVKSKEEFNWIDQKFNEKIDFYNSYLVGDKVFDRLHSNRALVNTNDDVYAVSEEKLRWHSDWYINILMEQRQSLPVSR